MQNAGLVLVVVLVEVTHQSARQKYDEASHLILSHFLDSMFEGNNIEGMMMAPGLSHSSAEPSF